MKYLLLFTLFLTCLISNAQLPSAGWTFSYPSDKFTDNALLDLRYLNEKTAGENGFIQLSTDGNSFQTENGKPIRLWSINGGDGTRSMSDADRKLYVNYTEPIMYLEKMVEEGQLGDLYYFDSTRVNLGLFQNDWLGAVGLDEWHALRLDIVTKADDPRLGAQDLRLDFYLDGELKASRIPEDSAILIDPARTGLGPHRSLVVIRDGYEGDAYGYFDNVRARYKNRIA